VAAGFGVWEEDTTATGQGGHRVRRYVPCPTHDTSDTCSDEDGTNGRDGSRGASDTRSDTPRIATAEPSHNPSEDKEFQAESVTGGESSVGSVMRRTGADAVSDPAEEVSGTRASVGRECQAPGYRWVMGAAELDARLPRELHGRVVSPATLMGNWTSGGYPWLASWLLSPTRLNSHLPPDISADTMGRLALIYLDRAGEIDRGPGCVCEQCGLHRPIHVKPPVSQWRLAPGCLPADRPLRYDLPEFFDRCPNCGDEAWMWEHRTQDRNYPRRDRAVGELGP
jgi:hypothetical protein